MKYAIAAMLMLAATGARATQWPLCGTIEALGNPICSNIFPGSENSAPIPPDTSWHLLTRTEGGTISLIKGLSKHECEFAMHRAKGEPATEEEIAAEHERDRAELAEAQDVCANPEKYAKSAGHVDATCSGGLLQSYGFSTMHLVQPGDIKSAECFQ